MTKVLCLPGDSSACGFYRIQEPARALQALGCDVDVLPPKTSFHGQEVVDVQTGAKYLSAILPPATDVLVMQRVSTRYMAQAIPLLQKAGLRVIVDFDDDLTAIDRRNAAFHAYHPGTSPDSNRHHASAAAAAADLVTVTSPALLDRYARHGRGTILPNCVPARYLEVPRYEGPARVVWSGQMATHPGDPDVTRGAVGRAVNRCSAEFYNVGTGEDVRAAFDLTDEPTTTGWVPLDDYPERYAQATVAVCPLRDTAFNRSKSWLKVLESLALGMPAVASDLPEYQRLAAHTRAVILASKPKHWEALLCRLLVHRADTEELSVDGRKAAAAFTVEANAHRWAEAWGL